MCLTACSEQTFSLRAFVPHTSPGAFPRRHELLPLTLVWCLWGLPELIWWYTAGPEDLQLRQKELERESSWQGGNYMYINMCVSLSQGRPFYALWSFKDCLRVSGVCEQQHSPAGKAGIRGLSPIQRSPHWIARRTVALDTLLSFPGPLWG